MLPRRPRTRLARALWHARLGRMQRALSLATALSAPPLGVEIYYEPLKCS